MTNSEKHGYKKRGRKLYDPDFDSKTLGRRHGEMTETAKDGDFHTHAL